MNAHTDSPCCVIVQVTHPHAVFNCFSLFLHVGRGNECTVAAGLTESSSEGEGNHNKQFSLQKMVNKTKVGRLRSFLKYSFLI